MFLQVIERYQNSTGRKVKQTVGSFVFFEVFGTQKVKNQRELPLARYENFKDFFFFSVRYEPMFVCFFNNFKHLFGRYFAS